MVDRVFAALRGGDRHRVGQATFRALGGGFSFTGAGGIIVCLECAGEGGGGQGFGVVAVVRQVAAEGFLGFGQENPVLGAFRAGDGRHHGGQVELQIFGVFGLGGVLLKPQALGFGVGFHQVDLFLRPAGEVQVFDGFFVDGEDGAGGAEFRRHVADGGPVGQRNGLDPVAVEFHEFLHHTVFAQHFGDGEHHVGGGGAGGDFAGEFEAHHLGDQHGDGLAEHGGFGFDAAHAPAENAETVFHGGVGVGADAGVWVGETLIVEHDAGQVFNIDLVDDAGSWGYYTEVGEVFRTPAQELVALLVAFVFDFHVLL